MKYPKPTKKKKNKKAGKAFQKKILKLDPICMVSGCGKPATEAHHIIYKSKWSTVIEERLRFDRDDPKNAIALCHEHHEKFHNGDGLYGVSGRQYAYVKLKELMDGNHKHQVRFNEIITELNKSLILKARSKYVR